MEVVCVGCVDVSECRRKTGWN